MDWSAILRRDPDAKIELVEAYTRIFTGHGSPDDAQIVLTDLADFTGFFSVSSDLDNLAQRNGLRMAFGRIFSFTNIADWERSALFNAAREAAIINQNQGEL